VKQYGAVNVRGRMILEFVEGYYLKREEGKIKIRVVFVVNSGIEF
jgi:hypothetical protein